MAKISILIVLLSNLLCIMVQGQQNPCSKYFRYMSEPGTINMLGEIEIPPPQANDEFHLRVALNILPETGQHLIRLKLAQTLRESIQAVQQGRPLLYHVYYPSDEPSPILSGIWFNNQQYCPSSESTGNIAVAILLGHIVYSPNEESFSRPNDLLYRNSSFYGIVNPNIDYLNALTRSERTVTVSPTDVSNNDCGITRYYSDSINRQIPNGEETSSGQWPWLVALFILIPDELVNKFQCSGSILTNKHVITAARCLKWGSTTVDLDYLYVSFGQFNSRKWHERGTINREVASYMIHPDADELGLSADSDLAILTVRIPIEYSGLIKAICMWSPSTDLQNTVDKGYVVGWGQDESFNRNVDEARMSRVSIVNQEDCLRSHSGFTNITSSRTFCAGLRDPNLCNADGGSGLMLYDATSGRYQLRGIAARTIHGLSPCFVPRQYIVYVDVAKYVPWILEQISAA